MTDSQSNNPNLHLIYKNLGETPHEAILRYKKDHPEHKDLTMTYAGRLDPMAEGVLLVLSDDLVFEKDKYLDLPKTYEFEILWGFETDTLDMLGIVTRNSFESTNFPIGDAMKEYLNKAIGKFEQIYPVYSSRPVNGKSLFQWAREGRISEIDIPKHEVELYEAEYLSRRTISKQDLLKDIEHKVGLVQGDFRQKEILEKWQWVLKDNKSEEFEIDKVKVVVSSGFYIRQFVHDIAESFGSKAVTFHIKRAKIGDYC
jgi:tRNA pseudouridine(55) synthase